MQRDQTQVSDVWSCYYCCCQYPTEVCFRPSYFCCELFCNCIWCFDYFDGYGEYNKSSCYKNQGEWCCKYSLPNEDNCVERTVCTIFSPIIIVPICCVNACNLFCIQNMDRCCICFQEECCYDGKCCLSKQEAIRTSMEAGLDLCQESLRQNQNWADNPPPVDLDIPPPYPLDKECQTPAYKV